MKRHQPRDCGKTLQLLDDFISGELSVESNREILSHLEHCASCRAEQQAREQVRDSLRQAWRAQDAPQGLQERILSGIETSPGAVHYVRRAAGFVLATLALYLAWQFFPLSAAAIDHYYQAVADHFRCEETFERTQPLPLPAATPELQQTVASLSGEYALQSAHVCQADGVEFMHYEFFSRASQPNFSIVMEVRGAQESLAQREDLVRQVIASLDVNVLQHDQATVFAFQTESYFVYLVSESKDPEKAEALAETLLPALDNLL